jgi:hypothetical protein
MTEGISASFGASYPDNMRLACLGSRRIKGDGKNAQSSEDEGADGKGDT